MRPRRRLDTRGGVFVEHLIVFMPLFTFPMCIFQETVLFGAALSNDHAAILAARAASVVVPDDPKRYGGEAVNTLGQKRKDAVRLAAIRALAPYVFDENVSSVDVTLSAGTGGTTTPIEPHAPITVRVDSVFQCKVPIAARIVCDTNGTKRLSATATLPNQGARFTYEGTDG